MTEYRLNQQELEQVCRLFRANRFDLHIKGLIVSGFFLALMTNSAFYYFINRSLIGMIVLPLSVVIFIGIFPKIVLTRLESGNYSGKIGVAKRLAMARGLGSIFVQDDDFLSAFISRAINNTHYYAAEISDEILVIRVLWVRYMVVRKLLA